MERRKVAKGTLIFGEGSAGTDMYVIVAGQIRIFRTVNAERVFLTTLSKNSFFGEMSLLLGGQRSASAEAAEDAELLVISQENLIEKIQGDPEFAIRLIRAMARRVKESDKIISKLEGIKRSYEIMYGMQE